MIHTIGKVKVWQENVTIPTYPVGEPEKYPVFLEKRVYQGSSGAVYPFPVIEKIYDHKVDKEWIGLFLENDYLKIMILPELGGRIQMAYDKMKDRHFIYYNQVIKPALVGLTGPWISGGIEFNWPQHHRPSTFDPVDFDIIENEDGSKSIWINEIERMSRTKGMVAFTLHSDKAYLEINVQLYNRTPHPQTFLWWANPAVHVNDHYQSVFPPDVHAVFDHGKRDVSSFPIAKGTYYKVDYSKGVDISKYKNIPVPTSYMAVNSKYDFVGGYENDTKGGLLHVANHHVSPGKKQWTWGNSDFGQAWDRNLTDEDGPYIELMCGVFTDNQPDFTWLYPHEEKIFTQYFMPYRDLGEVQNANKDAMIHVDFNSDNVFLKIYSTGFSPDCSVICKLNKTVLLQDSFDFTPGSVYEKDVSPDQNEDTVNLEVRVLKPDGKTLIAWKLEQKEEKSIPEPAEPAKRPDEIETIEQLYLNGLHLEQYRHATYYPEDYYGEALRRDSGDVRNNNAMGLWLMRRARYKEAESHFQKAIDRLTERNPNPSDGEPYFNLGISLKLQGKLDEAYSAFYKSVWNVAWQNAGYYQLALIDCINDNLDSALDHVEKSLIRNWHDHKARHLKIILLRKAELNNQVLDCIEESLKIDPFNFGAVYEKYLILNESKVLQKFKDLMRGSVQNYIEISLDYANAGFYKDASSLLELNLENSMQEYPITAYFAGWFDMKIGNVEKATQQFQKASQLPAGTCFPNRLEEVLMLKEVMEQYPNDDKAPYYLGDFYYAFREYEKAIDCWEQSEKLNPENPIVLRNLGVACFNQKNQKDLALQKMEAAFEKDPTSARLLMELDQLYKRFNKSYKERLDFLKANPELVDFRDDLYLEHCMLLNFLGDHEKALQMIMARQFHPWEGGEGKVTGQYLFSHVSMARKYVHTKEYNHAIQHLEAAQIYPHNLGEGKLYGAQENDIFYWLGCAYEGLCNIEKANQYWQIASKGLNELSAAMYYNDQQPDKIFYQGLALLKSGNMDEAKERFMRLVKYGEAHLNDDVKIDYFAVSLPDLLIWDDDLNVRNQMHCQYLSGLGCLGLKQFQKAGEYFDTVLARDRYHTGAFVHKELLQFFND